MNIENGSKSLVHHNGRVRRNFDNTGFDVTTGFKPDSAQHAPFDQNSTTLFQGLLDGLGIGLNRLLVNEWPHMVVGVQRIAYAQLRVRRNQNSG